MKNASRHRIPFSPLLAMRIAIADSTILNWVVRLGAEMAQKAPERGPQKKPKIKSLYRRG
jgi:hypothetical protein